MNEEVIIRQGRLVALEAQQSPIPVEYITAQNAVLMFRVMKLYILKDKRGNFNKTENKTSRILRCCTKVVKYKRDVTSPKHAVVCLHGKTFAWDCFRSRFLFM